MGVQLTPATKPSRLIPCRPRGAWHIDQREWLRGDRQATGSRLRRCRWIWWWACCRLSGSCCGHSCCDRTHVSKSHAINPSQTVLEAPYQSAPHAGSCMLKVGNLRVDTHTGCTGLSSRRLALHSGYNVHLMTLSFFQMSQHGHRGPAVIELKLLDPVCTVEHAATPLTSTRASKSLLQENERVLIAHSAPVLGAMQRSPACPIADKAGRSTRSPVALEFGCASRTLYLSLFPVLQARVNEIGVALLRHSLGVATGSFFAQPSGCFAQPSDSVHRDTPQKRCTWCRVEPEF